jgi:hypothetical protein
MSSQGLGKALGVPGLDTLFGIDAEGGMMENTINNYILNIGKSICDRTGKVYGVGSSRSSRPLSLTTAVMDYLVEKENDGGLPYVKLGPTQRKKVYAKGREAIPFFEYMYNCMGGHIKKGKSVSFADFMSFRKGTSYKYTGQLSRYVARAMKMDMNYCTLKSGKNSRNYHTYSSPSNSAPARKPVSTKEQCDSKIAANKVLFDKTELLMDKLDPNGIGLVRSLLETNNGYNHSSPTMKIEVQGITAIVSENVTIRVDLNEDGSPSSLEFRAS